MAIPVLSRFCSHRALTAGAVAHATAEDGRCGVAGGGSAGARGARRRRLSGGRIAACRRRRGARGYRAGGERRPPLPDRSPRPPLPATGGVTTRGRAEKETTSTQRRRREGAWRNIQACRGQGYGNKLGARHVHQETRRPSSPLAEIHCGADGSANPAIHWCRFVILAIYWPLFVLSG